MLKLIDGVVSILPKPLQELYHKYEDLMLYLIFGVLTTVVSFLSQGLVVLLLGKETAFAVSTATAFSWICAVTFAFITNKKYVFKSVTTTKDAFWTEVGTFYGARIVSLVLELVIMNVFNVLLGLNYWAVKIFAQIFIMLANYAFSKLVVFKDRNKTAK
jgi:putative flippase GtrA